MAPPGSPDSVKHETNFTQFIIGTHCLQRMILCLLSLVYASSARAEVAVCTEQIERNTVVLLFHRPTIRLLVIKSGRKTNQIILTKQATSEMLPDGVYSILRERSDPSHSRFRFVPRTVRTRIAWRGKALFAEGSMRRLAKAKGLRVPKQFAKELLRVTAPGAVLVVASNPSALKLFDDIGFFHEEDLANDAPNKCGPRQNNWRPQVAASPDDHVAIVISERDRTAYVYEGGELRSVHKVSVRYPHRDTGRHLFVAIKTDKSKADQVWLALSLAGGGFEIAPPVKQAKDVLDRFEFERGAQGSLDEYINRGVVLLVVERSARGESKAEGLITLLHSSQESAIFETSP